MDTPHFDSATIGPVGCLHLVFFGLIIPVAVVRSAGKMNTRPFPLRQKYFTSVLIQQLMLTAFSLMAARLEWIELFREIQRPAWSALAAAGFLALSLSFMFPRWKRNVIKRERKAYLHMPRTRREKGLWLGISAAAGFGEEVTYRGVMFILLIRLFGNAWMAALVAALIFAISHATQGRRSVGVIFVIALAFHGLVFVSGSLVTAMAVHFIYDVAAGFSYGYLGEKLGYPMDPMPPVVEAARADEARPASTKTEQTSPTSPSDQARSEG